jgi:hypothetical protein
MTNAGIIDYTIISTINNNNNGTDNSRTDRYGNSITESFNSRMENNDSTSINIFRYKFTKEFMEELYKFSKIHQYDHRKDFKEAWMLWKDENEEFISEEVRRLNLLGFNKDIEDKMFKSARYYFRKKNTEKKDPVIRRDYVGTSKEFILVIDEHIKSNFGNKPSECFSQFCRENIEELQKELIRLINGGFAETEIKDKIKKTYKNRYFIISKNIK